MPTDEKVEKVKNAIRDAVGCHTATGRPGVGCMTMDVPELCSCWVAAEAALSAAHAEPVASWECFRDEAFFDMWCVRPKGERRFGYSFHVTTEEEAEGLVALLSAPPSEAAIRADERAAIRKEAFKEAAQIGYGICAETRHVTLGDKVEAAIRARGER